MSANQAYDVLRGQRQALVAGAATSTGDSAQRNPGRGCPTRLAVRHCDIVTFRTRVE